MGYGRSWSWFPSSKGPCHRFSKPRPSFQGQRSQGKKEKKQKGGGGGQGRLGESEGKREEPKKTMDTNHTKNWDYREEPKKTMDTNHTKNWDYREEPKKNDGH